MFLLQPQFDLVTAGWQMVLVTTFKAKDLAAFAVDNVFGCEVRSLDYKVAFFIWTPFDVLVVVRELLAVPELIFLEVIDAILVNFILEMRHKHRVGDDHVAPQLRTFGEHACRTIAADLILEIVTPAGHAVLMPAL